MIPASSRRPTHVTRRDIHATVVLVRGPVEVASWPLTGKGRPDLSAVDALARLQLAARRLGCSIRLREPCAELVRLLDLSGLSGCLEVGGEPEGGEQPGVEEVVMPDDPVA
jgi:ABC-type transporter Mla MlaB component